MRLAVSNIAWHADEDTEVARSLVADGVDAIEIAPTRYWREPADATKDEARAVAAYLADTGLETVSFQSLLFARPDLTVFGGTEQRADAVAYLIRIATLAAAMGAGRMVFGSPRSRVVPEGMSGSEAFDIATGFFAELGAAAADLGTMFCIEPNPAVYGCNFVVTAAQGAALVEAVSSPGFGLHLDVAGLTLAGDDPAGAVRAFAGSVRHVHASAPQLGVLEEEVVDHSAFGDALREARYDGFLSIEMRAGEPGTNRARAAAAVALARRAYGL